MMKNTNLERHKKTCLFYRGDEFEDIIAAIFGDDAEVEYALEGSGISVYDDEMDIDDELIVEKLSEYFDVHVTSFHTDCYDDVGVWIVYKED